MREGRMLPGQAVWQAGAALRLGKTIEGKAFCFEEILAVCEQCTSNAECMDPFRCVKISGCDSVTAICLPACGARP